MKKKADYREIVKKFRRQQRAEKKMTTEERIALFDIWLLTDKYGEGKKI